MHDVHGIKHENESLQFIFEPPCTKR